MSVDTPPGGPLRSLQIVVGVVVTGVAVVAALYYAQTVLIPLLLAVFLTFLVNPLVHRLERWVPEGAAMGIVLTGLIVVLVGGSMLVGRTLYDVGLAMPAYFAAYDQEIAELVVWLETQGVEVSWQTLQSEQTMGAAWDYVSGGLGSVLSGVGQLVIILFMTAFMIAETHQFGRKVMAAFDGETGTRIATTTRSIAARVQAYVLAKTAISAVTGLVTTIVCWIFGVDFAVFWGVLTFLLNFIPNFGSIIAIVPPALIVLLQYGSVPRLVGLIASLTTVQMIIGNVIEPRVLGRSMSLSPLVVFVSMLMWGSLWGIIGIVLAVPLTVGIKIICDAIEPLRPVGVMLGEEPAPPGEEEPPTLVEENLEARGIDPDGRPD